MLLNDQTANLMRRGYLWSRETRGSADAVPTRLLGRAAVLVGGTAGVRRFYDGRLRRRGALPLPIRRVLFGTGTVHGLDDTAHHERKSIFVDTLTAAAVGALAREAEKSWSVAIQTWSADRDVVLFEEAVQVIAAAVLPWAGVPAEAAERSLRARQLRDIVGGFATPGMPYLRAVAARWQTDRWTRHLVTRARSGALRPTPGSALHAVSTFRDGRGRLLPTRVAATELHNFIRPNIAVAWFVAFAAVALSEHPDWRARIASGERGTSMAFAQEVRRHYPFVPVLAAKARHRQDVLGVSVPRGGLVILDVFGTDHDPRCWTDPDVFDPDRLRRRRRSRAAGGRGRPQRAPLPGRGHHRGVARRRHPPPVGPPGRAGRAGPEP